MNGDDPSAAENYRRAVVLYQSGRLQDAWGLCEKSLQHEPRAFGPLHLLGVMAFQASRPKHALELLAAAISLDPDNASAHNNSGNALLELGRREEAIASYDRAISIQPDLADAYYNRGNAYFDLTQYQRAIESYGRAIDLKSDYWLAHNNCGLAHWCQKQHAAAVTHYERAIAIEPQNPEAYNHRGHALHDLGQHAAAIASYEAAIRLKPDYAEAFNGRGSALASLNRHEAALESYDRGIAIRGEFAEAFVNRGNVLADMRRLDEAVASYDEAIARQPELAEAFYKRGDAQRNSGLFEAAVASYDKAASLNPTLKSLRGTRLHAKMHLCDWGDFETECAQLAACIERGENACPPFALLALSGSAHLQRQAAEIHVREECPATLLIPGADRYPRHGKIRVGYFSADFRNHPVAFLTAALFEAHDRSSFDVVGFSAGPDTQDDMRKRLEKGFDRFIDVRAHSDREVAMLARSMELDVAIDLGGFTNGARPAIFAMRAAPLQVGYLGYLGTTAAPYMDYLIADAALVPPRQRDFYSEKLLYLPSYQANDPMRRIADKVFTRDELGLPPVGFVFGCFNAPYKIAPAAFHGWMRILKQVPQSVLLLYSENSTAQGNLRAEARRAGVDCGRLVFGGRLAMPEYLARYRAVDLFLDTLPYNAGTTASDALWAGLPVLTCAGESFAGRMAASLLTAIDLPELIAESQEHYEALAVELGTNRRRLDEIRQRLDALRLVAPLFELPSFVNSLESAYRWIYERHHSGMPPQDAWLPSEGRARTPPA